VVEPGIGFLENGVSAAASEAIFKETQLINAVGAASNPPPRKTFSLRPHIH